MAFTDNTTSGIRTVEEQQSQASAAATAVYSISGVRMGSNTDNLPKGVYISNKKVIIKK